MANPERVSSFEPSMWKDFFITYEPEPLQISEKCMRVNADKLKEDVHMLFKMSNSTVVEKMTLLDTLQRLGIGHLFGEQINTTINEIHKSEFNSCNLNEVALHFCLLREHGLWVSPDVFSKFKGEDGCFNEEITKEPRGLLSLYNAAYLSVHCETDLVKAIPFATRHLELMRDNLKYPLSEQVKRNLEIPYPRTLNRNDAPYYIKEYEKEQTCNPSVLELAKLEFNLLQCLHQRELKEFCRWGNDLHDELELSYARNRVVECYFWSYMVHYELHCAHARMILAKVFVMLTILDDTLDMRATLEEGRKINEAIQSWDESAVHLLPNYFQKYFVKLMDFFGQIEDEMKPDHKYRASYAREALQILCKHYQQESEWFHSNYIPSFEDHLKISVISSGVSTVLVSSLVGMGDEVTEEAFGWAIGCTDAVRASSELGRIMNDIASFEYKKTKLDVASSVESYINQYHVTSEEAMDTLDNIVQDAWKTINQARFDRRVQLPLVNQVVRLTKSMTYLYREKKDTYTYSRLIEDKIKQQFVDPIPL